MGVRRPSVAGQFYSGSPEGLRGQIEASFESELGPGLPGSEPGSSNRVKGVGSRMKDCFRTKRKMTFANNGTTAPTTSMIA